MAEQLIQTRVPQPVGAWVLSAAESDGISVAAWLRRSVTALAGGTRVDVWLARPRESLATYHYSAPRAHATLQLIERDQQGRSLFSILHPPTHAHAGLPWSEHWFKDSELFSAQSDRVLVLRGSPVAWRILSSMYDSSTERVLLLAEPVPELSQVRILLDHLEDSVKRHLVASGHDPRDLVLGLTREDELVLLSATAADVGAELAARVLTEGPRTVFASLFGLRVAWAETQRTIGKRQS